MHQKRFSMKWKQYAEDLFVRIGRGPVHFYEICLMLLRKYR
ncbi:hypothetical protein ERO13_A01G122950v2 [Gossypium hirsutum]|nr:hypothetical protein ERO13_A01G122950v2 [Gossypium hirsutum]